MTNFYLISALFFICGYTCWGLPYFITFYKEKNKKTRMDSITLKLDNKTSKYATNNEMEDSASLFSRVVRYTHDSGLCYPLATIRDSFELECEAKSVYDDYKIDRIPPFLPQIKCESKMPFIDAVNDRFGFECVQVMHLVPFMYQINETSLFRWRFSSISTGCIKVRKSSFMELKKADSEISAISGESSKQVSNTAVEDSSLLMTGVIRHTNLFELCYPPDRIGDSFNIECEGKVVYDDYKIDRIPPFLPQIKCKSKIPSTNVPNNRIGFECKEIKYLLPVIYQINKTSLFKWRFYNISTDCIKVKTQSPIEQKKADSEIPAIIGQAFKHTSNTAVEDSALLMTGLVRQINHSGLCYPPEKIGDSFEFECEPKTEYEYKIDRIPQLLPQVTCESKIPSTGVLNNRIGFGCQEVMQRVPVMYQINEASLFKWRFSSISTGCIKVKTSSLMVKSSPNSTV